MKWLKLLFLFSPLFISLLGFLNFDNANAWESTDPFFSSNQSLTLFRSYMEQAEGAPYIVNDDQVNNYTSSDYIVGPTQSPIVTKTLFGFTTAGYEFFGDDISKQYHSAQAIFYFTAYNSSYISLNNVPITAKYVLSDDVNNSLSQYVSCTLSYEQMSSAPFAVSVSISCPQVTYKGSGYHYKWVDLTVGTVSDNQFNSDYFYQYRNGGGIKVSVTIGQYIVSSTDNATELALEQITEQNQIIINQNQEIINQMEATNDWLTDDTAPSVDTSGLGNAAGWLPPGPLDSILNLPVQFIQGIIGVFTNTDSCAPIVLPLGLIDYDLEIPCMRPFFEIASVNIVWNTVGTIISAVLIFNTLKWLYKFVDDTLSFRESNNSIWGGL